VTAGSLFTGIGGFDLACERAGIETLWQVEIDDKCQTTLAKHFPNATRYKDVTEVGRHNLSPVDIITGGFPCQDLSVAGKRAGLAGSRSGLWSHFHRIIQELNPRWVVIENVPGLLSSNGGRDFAVVLRGLEDIGYHASWRVLDAQYAGVAQRRRRVFVVASLGDYGCIPVLFESESVSWNPPSRQEAGKVTPTLSSSGTGTSRTSNDRTEAEFCVISGQSLPESNDVSPTLDTSHNNRQPHIFQAQGRSKYVEGDDKAAALRANSHQQDVDLVNVCTTIRSSGPMNDDNAAQAGHLVESYWDGGQVADTLDVSAISKGQMMPDKRRFPCVMQSGVRRLTPTECERLQGFPDGWTTMHKDTNRYKQLGNAVAVPVVEWIINRIAARTPRN